MKKLKPIIVMVAICLVTALALGLTNELTKDRIAANAGGAEDSARLEVLPDADSFEEVLGEDASIFVKNVYKAKNGAGYVVTAYGAGYGGDVPVMVGFTADGEVTGVKILTSDAMFSETTGIGDKTDDPAYTDQFKGTTGEVKSVKDAPAADGEIQVMSGATITSGGVVTAVNNARNGYIKATGGEVKPPEEEDPKEIALPDGADFEEITANWGDTPIKTAYKAGNGAGYIVVGYLPDSGYKEKDIIAMVGFTEDGTITGLTFIDLQETKGIGTQINEEPFTSQFVGKKGPFTYPGLATVQGEEMDLITGATISSKAAVKAINNAVAGFELIEK